MGCGYGGMGATGLGEDDDEIEQEIPKMITLPDKNWSDLCCGKTYKSHLFYLILLQQKL